MPREYYDRGGYPPAERLLPASYPKQEAYWLLRSHLTSAIAANWQAVLDSSPEIARAAQALDTYVGGRPNTEFRIFRPEDLDSTHFFTHSSPIFLR